MSYIEFDPNATDAELLDVDADTRTEIVEYFPCPACDGHGSKVIRVDGRPVRAELCDDCGGSGVRGATEEQCEAASQIGSDNPFCPHDWSSGYDDSDHEVPIRCSLCGADGDA